jgi:predicted metalloprotease
MDNQNVITITIGESSTDEQGDTYPAAFVSIPMIGAWNMVAETTDSIGAVGELIEKWEQNAKVIGAKFELSEGIAEYMADEE